MFSGAQTQKVVHPGIFENSEPKSSKISFNFLRRKLQIPSKESGVRND
jgi:hypothetical protein